VKRSRVVQVVAAIVVSVVALNLVLFGLRLGRGGGTHGRRSSSYATAPLGVAAYAELLERSGYDVERLRVEPARARLDPSATVVVLDPSSLRHAGAMHLRRFAEDGGRLVVGGAHPGDWLRDLVDPAPEWSGTAIGLAMPLASVPEVAGLRRVASAGEGSWGATGATTPALGEGRRSLLLVRRLGRGRLLLLADASPLQNRLLATADDAAYGLDLAGVGRRRVVFVESVHGYGQATGLAAIPGRWRWALGGIVLAGVLLAAAHARRLGPPELESRPLPPPRREYVESLGGVLARTRSAEEAIAPVREAARAELARRAGAGATDEAALRRAASTAGLAENETAAVLGSVRRREDVLAAGRALARLRGRPT
jgi:Domain of unknown function (DUF4350)